MLRAQNEPVKRPPSQHKRLLELISPRSVSVLPAQLSEGGFPYLAITLVHQFVHMCRWKPGQIPRQTHPWETVVWIYGFEENGRGYDEKAEED